MKRYIQKQNNGQSVEVLAVDNAFLKMIYFDDPNYIGWAFVRGTGEDRHRMYPLEKEVDTSGATNRFVYFYRDENQYTGLELAVELKKAQNETHFQHHEETQRSNLRFAIHNSR